MLHRHSSPDVLLELLESYLPYSLPVYNCLVLNRPSFTYLATFEHDTSPSIPFLMIVDMGHQLRMFCSLDGAEIIPIEEEQKEIGGKLVIDGIKAFVKDFSSAYKKAGVIKFGAVNSYWIPFLRREPELVKFINFESCVICSPWPLNKEISSRLSTFRSTSSSTSEENHMIIRAGLPEDLDEIVRTLKVDHSPSYLLSNLAHSTLLISNSNVIGHCMTHYDGSIGTLEVNPEYRNKGFGKLIVEDRMLREERRSFSYVDRSNVASIGVFESLGWIKPFDCCWVGIQVYIVVIVIFYSFTWILNHFKY